MASSAPAAHVFVDDLEALEPDPADEHHLRRVLRLRAGEQVTASDGVGGRRLCVVGASTLLEPVGEVEREARPSPTVTIGFALAKGDRPEWAVQKLTEVGVDVMVPVACARSVVRWDEDKATRNVARLQRIAREAAMQCRRAWLPEVAPLATFAGALGLAAGGVAMAERGGPPPSLGTPAVLVGPEGGWSEQELGADVPRVGLGPHVLRAETAAVAAGLLLGALRAGVVLVNDH